MPHHYNQDFIYNPHIFAWCFIPSLQLRRPGPEEQYRVASAAPPAGGRRGHPTCLPTLTPSHTPMLSQGRGRERNLSSLPGTWNASGKQGGHSR
ncbi:hypothetical protein E2C01_102282 [Portunus trituberculatus]|uniref:Uncharacterized protein n=1 Tax=Portunus trituberculatus TaxID=210409 RepID=A0A5B7KM78_PORTR|nr:hypothetical protein [Portunus trituberculatus]